MSEGEAWPSVGSHEAPMRSSTFHQRPHALDLGGRDQLHLHAEAAGGGGEALEFGPAVLGGREAEAAGHLPAGGEAGLGFEGLVELDGALQHLGDRGRGAQLADETGGMPGGAGGELALLEQNDVGLVVLGEMIGGRAADDAAADDDDLRVSRGRSSRRTSRGRRRGRSSSLREILVGIGLVVDARRDRVRSTLTSDHNASRRSEAASIAACARRSSCGAGAPK